MSNYNPKCWMCNVVVYSTPVLAIIFMGWLVSKMHNPVVWVAYVLASIITLPTAIYINKRAPMLHEYFKPPIPHRLH